MCKKKFFKLGQIFLVFMLTFELICMLLEGYLKIFTLSGFFGGRRRQIVSAGSTCVDLFLAQAQHA